MHDQADIEDDDEESDEDVIYMGTTSSMWQNTVNQIRAIVEDQSSMMYLDFIKDVDEVSELLQSSLKLVGKYTGQFSVEERKLADHKFFVGDLTVLVATESFELGVDNPNINQLIRIGCSRNLGVLL